HASHIHCPSPPRTLQCYSPAPYTTLFRSVIESVLDHDHRLRADVLTSNRVRRLRRKDEMISRSVTDREAGAVDGEHTSAAAAAGAGVHTSQLQARRNLLWRPLLDEVSNTR